MIHILFFIESLSGGGAEKVLVTLLKHLDYSKFNVTLMPLIDTGVLRNDIDMSNINYSPIIIEPRNPWQRIWNKIKYKLIYQYLPDKIVNRWIIPQTGIDIYVAFVEGFCTRILSLTPKKKIAWVHADLKFAPWTQNARIYHSLDEEAIAYQKFDNVVCVSKNVEEVMKEQYGVKRSITIYNPIDTEDILNKAKQPIQFSPTSSFKIVSVGRLVPLKGFDRLITIIGTLRRENRDIELYILGEGRERQNLEDIINKEHIQESVHLVGYMSNPYALMTKMDLFVCSSTSEGYSLAIAEAMTLGLPVLSTDCAGPKETLSEGRYGYLVKNSEQGLYEGINTIINQPTMLHELKQKSLERSKFFGYSNTIKQIENLVLQRA